jgi:hypothetical protein
MGPLSYGANGTLGDTILMMGANARVADHMPLVGAILHEMLGAKWEIIGVVVLDINAMLASPVFKLVLSFQSFTDSKGYLVLVADYGRGMVNK